MRGFLLLHAFLVLVCVCVLTVFVCGAVGPSLWYSSSFVGHGSLEEVEQQERARHAAALVWASSVKLALRRPKSSHDKAWFVCLAMATGERNGSHYAPHALHSLLGGLSEQEMNQVYAIAIVGHAANPLPSVLKQFHEVKREERGERRNEKFHPFCLQVVEEPPNLGKAPYLKVKLSHATALEMCRSKSNLTLWIEDDVSASRNLVDKLKLVIARAEEFARLQRKEWILVKLFYSDFWSGWSTDTTPKFLIVSSAIGLAGFGLVAVSLRLLRKPPEFVIISFMFVVAGLFCLFWISFNLGRQNVFPDFSRGINKYKGALAQALLYDNRHVKEIDNLKLRLRNEKGILQNCVYLKLSIYFVSFRKDERNYDLVIDDWVEETKDKVASIFWPCLFQHMGVKSSMGGILHKDILRFWIPEVKRCSSFENK